MKYKFIKSVAMVSLAISGASFAQEEGSDRESGVYYQTLDGLSKTKDPNSLNNGENKGFDDTGYFVFLGASGAVSTNSGMDYSYVGGGCMRANSGTASNGDFDLDLQLPDGHQIEGYRYYWYDDNASSSQVQLFKFDGSGGITFWDANVSTGDTGYGNEYLNLFSENIIIDNSTGYYVFRFSTNEEGNNQRMCGVRLYIITNPA